GSSDLQVVQAVRERWLGYQFWHPSRRLFVSTTAEEEAKRQRLLDEQLHELRCQERLAEVRRRASDPDANPETVWALFQQFRTDFPDRDIDSDLQEFRETLKARRDADRERRAQTA